LSDPSSAVCLRRQGRDRLDQRFDRPSGGFRAERDGFVGAMKVEQADAAEARLNENVRRIAREPRPGDAILHDVEGFAHHGEKAGTVGRAEHPAFDVALGAEHAAQPVSSGKAVAQGVVRITPIWANPRAAPPPSAKPMLGRPVAGAASLSVSVTRSGVRPLGLRNSSNA
jgi:hypothetical protein